MEKHAITLAVTTIIPLVRSDEANSVSLDEVSQTVQNVKGIAPQLFPDASQDDIDTVVWRINNHFNVGIGGAVVLNNPNVERWLDEKRTEINWDYYNAYKKLLQNQERPASVISENEKIIDSILDLSGDPTLPGKWARKGLVMGNVHAEGLLDSAEVTSPEHNAKFIVFPFELYWEDVLGAESYYYEIHDITEEPIHVRASESGPLSDEILNLLNPQHPYSWYVTTCNEGVDEGDCSDREIKELIK